MKNKKEETQYVVKKYIMAISALDAIKKEKSQEPDDVFVNQEYVERKSKEKMAAIGFTTEIEDE